MRRLVCVQLLLASLYVLERAEGFEASEEVDPHVIWHPHDPVGPLDKPVQCVHLHINDASSMRVVWLSPQSFSEGKFKPACKYGLRADEPEHEVAGRAWTYSEGMFQWTLNTALLDTARLDATQTKVFYQCGDPVYGWDIVRSFTPQQEQPASSQGSGNPPSVAVVGDLGVGNGDRTVKSIQTKVTSHNLQLLIHLGDIGYANEFGRPEGNNSMIWVDLMNQLEGIVGQMPYMTLPGNHERQWSFAAYRNWLQMPRIGPGTEFWYSFDYLGVHFVSFSTEHDFSPDSVQWKWIKEDLEKANKNRAKVPWIMVMGHRPFYCSSVVNWFDRWVKILYLLLFLLLFV